MIRSRISGIALRIGMTLLPAAALTNGCASDHGSAAEQATTGTLTMPLVTTANGHQYRLNGYLYYSGPEFGEVPFGDQPEVHLSLQTGSYFAYLGYFTLQRLGDDGTWSSVSATLLSSYEQQFTIYDHTTTTVSFQFQTDGVIVTVGSGNLNIDINVSETAPVCTILGTDCPSGLWCAPPELTGQTLACVGAGSVAVGAACNAPADCAANASCFDFGAGAVCGALCNPSSFGAECASGGTCTKAASDYGICVPAGGTFPDSGTGGGGSGGGGTGGAAGAP